MQLARLADPAWKRLQQKLQTTAETQTTKSVFGKSAIGGNVYRWGVAVAIADEIDSFRMSLSQLACDQKPKRRSSTRPRDFTVPAKEAIEHFSSSPVDRLSAADAVVWAAAMPKLTTHLHAGLWWDLLGALLHYRESILQDTTAESPLQLMVGAELGLTMAWRLAEVPSCKRQAKSSHAALARWSENSEDAVPALLADVSSTRLVLASLLRCRSIVEKTTKQSFPNDAILAGQSIATWVAAMTTLGGGCTFQTTKRKLIVDDLNDFGLLSQATEFDPESLTPAIAAVLGEPHKEGQLAWEVSLPESFHHCDKAKVAALLPQWNVRRGRIHLQYSGTQNSIELFAGRCKIVSGELETKIAIDSIPQRPNGDWTYSCEYTDDDVHYLELEQPWTGQFSAGQFSAGQFSTGQSSTGQSSTGELFLQRQIMLLREDRCVLFADSVLTSERSQEKEAGTGQLRKIDYSVRLPIYETITIEADPETREVFLSGSKRQAMLIPLSASEWCVGPSLASLKETETGDLEITAVGNGSLYVPLWFDFQQRRFKRKRTWRQLTIADERRICTTQEAVGFRVQSGSEQWMLYRSLGQRRCRTIMGKHLVADFFAARFDMSDAVYEELVTVDDSEQMDD